MIKKYFLFIIFFFILTPTIADSIELTLEIGNKEPITSPIASYDPTINSYPDPFDSDEIIFEINKDNYLEYAEEILTLGQIEMFENYPDSFKMNVYQSRRSCAVPIEVTNLTSENATLTDNGEGIEGVVGVGN